ncbi:hypothetical protein BDF19DRAFT_432811 [Syncephalis fuscata]|nr:hypothetical protein BDF19DRAFT_432811 [Syncephalis fuscata]
MKFDHPPPYAPYCDYKINITDCRDGQSYLQIYLVGIFIHLLVFFWGAYIVIRYANLGDNETRFEGSLGDRFRQFVSQPLKPASIFSTIFVGCRVIHNTLCAFDLIPSLKMRTLSSLLSMIPGFWATLFFAAGIVETVQLTIGRLPDSNDVPNKEMFMRHAPTRVLALSSLAVLGIFGTTVPVVLSFLAGLKGEAGDWHGYFDYLKLSWCTLGMVFVALGILYAYYAVVLSKLLRQLAPKLLQSNQDCQKKDWGFSPSATTKIGNDNFDHTNNIKVPEGAHTKITQVHSIVIQNDKPCAKFAALYEFAFKEKKTVQSEVSLAESEALLAETKERSEAINRLQKALRHLIFHYCAGAIGSFLWGLGAKWLIVTPVVNKLSAIVFLAVIWPLAAGGVLWHRWQMERARIRRERRRIGLARVAAA